MKYVIMCGGTYLEWETPKQLLEIHGEALVDRTIRLLKAEGAEDICITATDPRFEDRGVPVLKHENNFITDGERTLSGYWLDAFYPRFPGNTQVTYIFGDVYFTENAIRTIVHANVKRNTLVGHPDAKNPEHHNIGEPFAYIVTDYRLFMYGVECVKRMRDAGLLLREPIVWELYRYLNGFDVNVQWINDATYICIDDGTIDADTPEKARELIERLH